jgi:hypothetical protein
MVTRETMVTLQTPTNVQALTKAAELKQAKAAVLKIETDMKKADKMTVLKAFDPQRNLSSLFEVSPSRTIGGYVPLPNFI